MRSNGTRRHDLEPLDRIEMIDGKMRRVKDYSHLPPGRFWEEARKTPGVVTVHLPPELAERLGRKTLDPKTG